MEKSILKMTQELKIGAQFGGKYFCHDVRVIRLPRHGASLPISIGVSCGADRQIIGKINKNGMFLEKLEKNPSRYLPRINLKKLTKKEKVINLNKPIKETIIELSKLKVKTRLLLNGTLIVARDIAHSKLKEELDKGKPLPSYFKENPIYYAGPAKKPDGYASGSFGPTTAGRMDSYVNLLMENGASMIMLAKGNRSEQVKEACGKWGGFYLGTIGGAAARLAQDAIKKVEVIDFEELGMEAVHKVKIENFPAFVVINDSGDDFYAGVKDRLVSIEK